MPAIVVMLVGFGAGLMLMTIVNLYKWVLQVLSN